LIGRALARPNRFGSLARGNRPTGAVLIAPANKQGCTMNSIIYIIGLVVVVAAVLSFYGLR
jgi:hypothetical protein